MATESPTSRTKKLLEKRGLTVDMGERWMPSHNIAKVVAAAKEVNHRWQDASTESLYGLNIALIALAASGPGVRKDLFGFIDLVAIGDGRIIAYQATTRSNMLARVAKIKNECRHNARQWTKSGGRIVVIGWKKYKKARGGRWWRETETEIIHEDLVDEPAPPF